MVRRTMRKIGMVQGEAADGAANDCDDSEKILVVYGALEDYFYNDMILYDDAYVMCVYDARCGFVVESFVRLKGLLVIIIALKAVRRLAPRLTYLGYDFGEDFIG